MQKFASSSTTAIKQKDTVSTTPPTPQKVFVIVDIKFDKQIMMVTLLRANTSYPSPDATTQTIPSKFSEYTQIKPLCKRSHIKVKSTYLHKRMTKRPLTPLHLNSLHLHIHNMKTLNNLRGSKNQSSFQPRQSKSQLD